LEDALDNVRYSPVSADDDDDIMREAQFAGEFDAAFFISHFIMNQAGKLFLEVAAEPGAPEPLIVGRMRVDDVNPSLRNEILPGLIHRSTFLYDSR
jgi:hypothetical protein